jgi:hypothetical protein
MYVPRVAHAPASPLAKDMPLENINMQGKQGVTGFISQISVAIKTQLPGLQLRIALTVGYRLFQRNPVGGDKMWRMKTDKSVLLISEAKKVKQAQLINTCHEGRQGEQTYSSTESQPRR